MADAFGSEKASLERAQEALGRADGTVAEVEAALRAYLNTYDYIPQGVRRPQMVRLQNISGEGLQRLGRHLRDATIPQQTQATPLRTVELRQTLEHHNEAFVLRMVKDHSKLLLDELGLGWDQCQATVRGIVEVP